MDDARSCDGDGACAPARLHDRGYACAACGSASFDHETDTPDAAFCLDCGVEVSAEALGDDAKEGG